MKEVKEHYQWLAYGRYMFFTRTFMISDLSPSADRLGLPS